MKAGTNQLHNTFYEINTAWAHIKKAEHETALSILQKIPKSRINDLYPKNQRQYYLGLARSLSSLKRYQEAIDQLNKIPTEIRNPAVNICFAVCYENLKAFDTALQYLDAVSHSEKNPQVQMSKGYVFEKMGRLAEAEKMLRSLLNNRYPIEEKTQVLLTLARVYQNMGDLKSAKKTFKKIENWQHSEKTILSLSILFMGMGKYAKANAIIMEHLDWKNNAEARLCLSRIQEELDNYDSAIKYITDIPNWEKLKRLQLAAARVMHKAGYFKEVENQIHHIENWKNDQAALLSLAQCQYDQGLFEEAENYYQKILKKGLHVSALIGLVKCYQQLNDQQNMNNTLALLKRHFPSDKQARLTTAVSQEGYLPYPQMIAIYDKLVNDFPYYMTAYFYRCRYLVNQYKLEAIEHIKAAQTQFPYSPQLYLLEAKYYRDNNCMEKAYKLLKSNAEQFPFHVSTLLELIRHYLLINEYDHALVLKSQCLKRFEGHTKLERRIDEFFNTSQLVKAGGHFGLAIVSDEEHITNVPSYIQEELDDLKSLPGISYFTGGTALALYLGKYQNLQDLDLVNPDERARAILPALGFTKSLHISNLFVKRTERAKIDYFCRQHNALTENWNELYDVFNRDFTIAAIYAYQMPDGRWKFLDLTGMGLKDAKLGILRMIGHPSLRLNPIRCLRAMHYLRLGYMPESSLEEALHVYEGDVSSCKGHLVNTMRDYLTRENPELFVQNMQKYRFISKFFPDFVEESSLIQTTRKLLAYFGLSDFVGIKEESKEKEKEKEKEEENKQQKEETESVPEKPEPSSLRKRKKTKKELTERIEQLTQSIDKLTLDKQPIQEIVFITVSQTITPLQQIQSKNAKKRLNRKNNQQFDFIIEQVLIDLALKYQAQIKPSEMETARMLIKERMKKCYVNIPLLDEEKVKQVLFDLLDGAVYSKNIFQLLSPHNFVAGCHPYGIQMENLTHGMVEFERTPKQIYTARK